MYDYQQENGGNGANRQEIQWREIKCLVSCFMYLIYREHLFVIIIYFVDVFPFYMRMRVQNYVTLILTLCQRYLNNVGGV